MNNFINNIKIKYILTVIILMVINNSKIFTKNYKILVLPSGGATSVCQADILTDIEHKTGKKINKLFDEIWCSSAGAIIAALSEQKTALEILKFIEFNFSNIYKAYNIINVINKEIIKKQISKTSIPIRILTAACYSESKNKWCQYDFSSDGKGSCENKNIEIQNIVAASCTVYPYVYKNPVKIVLSNKKYVYCIDPGSLCCQQPAIDPTAYFLKQLITRITEKDTIAIFFIGNLFTQTIDYDEINAIVNENSKKINLEQLKIVNIYFTIDCDKVVDRAVLNSDITNKIKLKTLKFIFTKILGKEIASANLLAAGAINLSELKKESQKIIKNSQNYKNLLNLLQKDLG